MSSLTQLDGVVATDLPLPKRFPARESPIAFVLTGLALPGRLGLATCLVALYVLLGWVVNTFATVPLTEPPWNPSSGLGLACLLTLGLSWTPVLYLGILISELTVSLAQPSLAQAILESALSTAGYVALAGLLRSGPLAIDIRLTRTRDMVIFSLTTGSVTLLMALFYAMLRSDLNVMLTFGDARHLVRFWIGELVGILVFAPLLLLFWAGRLRFSLRSQDAFLHGFGIFLTVLFAFWVVYGNVPAEQITSLYLMFLPLIWAALRFGLPGSLLTLVILQSGIILLSHLGSQSDATVMQFQIRLLAIAITGLFLGVAVDELHQTEQQLRERQSELDRTLRLAASAELATAMAHELNQPLSAIGIYARSCEMMIKSQPFPELNDTIVKMGAEVKRAGNVVHKLREFYRSGGSQHEPVAVSDLLREAVDGLRERATRYGIAITIHAERDLPMLSVDRVQIGTVIHNLLANSIDAIRDAGSKDRLIQVRATVHGRDALAMAVQDSGPGMSDVEAAQLFRPFSTSKAYGLGLGLSMSRSIVQAHGGTLEKIAGGAGCCFRITLPLVSVVDNSSTDMS